jgi:serine protease Do
MRAPRRRSGRLTITASLSLLLLLGAWTWQGGTQWVLAAGSPQAPACTESISDIYDRVSPAVVFITATSIRPYQPTDRVQRVVGSGFIFDATGLILTNSHVAFGRQFIGVTLDDGTVSTAQVVGADPIFDLAVLRITAPSGRKLPVVPLGDSDQLRVGADVVAIGNPLGLDQTLTKGIVSAINRILPNTPLSLMEPMIQTDTPINPGNSGGPLLDRCGVVIGINTAMLPEAQNIGFAIPINLAKLALPSLLEKGHIVRPWIGIQGQFVESLLQDVLRVPLTRGLLVEVVEPGSPAEQAGLRGGQLEVAIAGRSFLVGGDIVTQINGTLLDSPDALVGVMKDLKVGAPVRMKIFRNGQYREVEYVLPERPLLPMDIPGQSALLPLTGRRTRPELPADFPRRKAGVSAPAPGLPRRWQRRPPRRPRRPP